MSPAFIRPPTRFNDRARLTANRDALLLLDSRKLLTTMELSERPTIPQKLPAQTGICHLEHHDSPWQFGAGMNPRRTNKRGTVPRFAPFFWRKAGEYKPPPARSRGAERCGVERSAVALKNAFNRTSLLPDCRRSDHNRPRERFQRLPTISVACLVVERDLFQAKNLSQT